jgi:hypothetical protein
VVIMGCIRCNGDKDAEDETEHICHAKPREIGIRVCIIED